MIYQWKEGAHQKLDAQRVGDHLEELHAQHGGVTAEIVVREASRKRSPLHAGFTWDDTEAAKEYRLEEARRMIRSVVVISKRAGEPDIYTAYVSVRDEEGQRYLPIYEALSNEQTREQGLRRALQELQSWQRRYHDFEELAVVFQAMTRVPV